MLTILETSKHDSSFQFISQWNLLAITIVFTTMGIIELRHSMRLTKFNVNVRASMRSNGSAGDMLMIDDANDGDTKSDSSADENLEQPWTFWKWLIPVYSAILCVSVLLTFSFWVTVMSSDEFLLYIGDDNKAIWDLLPTLPTAYMLIEFPFNMIPIDWPMIIFVEALFSLYLFANFLVVTI